MRAGDRVTLENAAGQRADIPVSGITENYLTAYAYLTPEAYRTAFGQEPSFTTLLCRAADGIDADTLTQGALAGEHVLFARSSLSLKADLRRQHQEHRRRGVRTDSVRRASVHGGAVQPDQR